MTTVDIQTVKARMKATWMAGDYANFARFLELGALEILARWQIAPGSRMLDVGCGAGQIAIPAARAGVQVTGIDIADNLIDHARHRAEVEDLSVRFDVGDAEDLPYSDESFDVVVSLIGAMFAPRPDVVAAEMIRVCRPGGRILMANWVPDGLVGRMFKAIAKHVPPPPGIPPAVLWGDETAVRERFGDRVETLTMTRRAYVAFAYPFGVPQVVEFFRQNYGPTQRAFAALDADGQASLRGELESAFAAHNLSADGTAWLKSEYLEIEAVRRH